MRVNANEVVDIPLVMSHLGAVTAVLLVPFLASLVIFIGRSRSASALPSSRLRC